MFGLTVAGWLLGKRRAGDALQGDENLGNERRGTTMTRATRRRRGQMGTSLQARSCTQVPT
jgi:hypothetical protein